MRVTWKNMWHVGSATFAFFLLGFGGFLFLSGGLFGWIEFWRPRSLKNKELTDFLFGLCFIVVFYLVPGLVMPLLSRLDSEWKILEIFFSCLVYAFVVEYTFFGWDAFLSRGMLYSLALLAFSFISAVAGLPRQEENKVINVS